MDVFRILAGPDFLASYQGCFWVRGKKVISITDAGSKGNKNHQRNKPIIVQ